MVLAYISIFRSRPIGAEDQTSRVNPEKKRGQEMEQEHTAQSLSTVLASEERLISEAAEALPHQFSVCTYSMGYIRQAVYLCLTCSVPRGICSACSIACHTNHEQVELFPKRRFRCDCPTTAIEHPCTLHKTCEAENSDNVYGQNFKGIFCRCGRPYDAKQERETMVQCLACEVSIIRNLGFSEYLRFYMYVYSHPAFA